MVIPLVSRVVIAGAAPLVVTALFSFKEQIMSTFLRKQEQVECYIDSDDDLNIIQTDEYGIEHKIFINALSIDMFVDILQLAIKDGYVGERE